MKWYLNKEPNELRIPPITITTNEENPVVKKQLAFDKEAEVFMSEKIADGELSKAKKMTGNEEVDVPV